MAPKPSIAIWINPATQEVKNDFMPQELHPGEYGVCLAMTIAHIARSFVQSNPQVPEAEIIAEIMRGIETGLRNVPPPTPMVAH